MKKLVSMLLALAMVLTLAGGAMAETKDYSGYTIRIYSNSNSTERTNWLINEAKNAGFTILSEELGAEQYGIAFRADDKELCSSIEGAVKTLVDNGTYAKIAEKYPDIVNNLLFLN